MQTVDDFPTVVDVKHVVNILVSNTHKKISNTFSIMHSLRNATYLTDFSALFGN